MLHTVVWLLAIGIAFFNLLQQPSIFQWGNPLAGYGWGCRPHGCEAAGLHWGWKSAANIPISVRTTTMAGRDLPRQYLISRRYLRCLVSSWNGKSVPKIFSYDCFFLVWISRPKKLAFNHGLDYKDPSCYVEMKKVPFKVLENLDKIIFQSFITVIAEN